MSIISLNQRQSEYWIGRNNFSNTNCDAHARSTSDDPDISATGKGVLYQHHTVAGGPPAASGNPHVEVTYISHRTTLSKARLP